MVCALFQKREGVTCEKPAVYRMNPDELLFKKKRKNDATFFFQLTVFVWCLFFFLSFLMPKKWDLGKRSVSDWGFCPLPSPTPSAHAVASSFRILPPGVGPGAAQIRPSCGP